MSSQDKNHLLRGRRILVVEDEPDSLEVVTILLEMYGAQVYSATNGREGLAEARKHQPDFIISDLSMPEMSGWEMMHHMKDDRSTMHLPVIALTAHAMTGDRERALAAGFHNYLSKPLNPESFLNELLRLVADTPELARILNNEEV